MTLSMADARDQKHPRGPRYYAGSGAEGALALECIEVSRTYDIPLRPCWLGRPKKKTPRGIPGDSYVVLFLDMTYFLKGILIYYPKRNYAGVSRHPILRSSAREANYSLRH